MKKLVRCAFQCKTLCTYVNAPSCSGQLGWSHRPICSGAPLQPLLTPGNTLPQGQLVDRQYQLTSSRGQPSGQIHLRVHMNSAGMPSQPAGAYGAGYQQSYGAAQPAMAPSGGYAPAMPAPMGHAPAPAMSAYPMGGSAPMGSMPPTYGTTPGMPAHTGYPGSAPMPMAGGAYPGAPGMATGYPATGAGYPAGGMPATGYAPGMPAAGMPAMPGTAPGSAGAPMAGAMAQGLGISGPSGASPYQHHQPYQRL